MMLAKEQRPVDISLSGVSMISNAWGFVILLFVAWLKNEFEEVPPALSALSGLQVFWIVGSCVVGTGISFAGVWVQRLISAHQLPRAREHEQVWHHLHRGVHHGYQDAYASADLRRCRGHFCGDLLRAGEEELGSCGAQRQSGEGRLRASSNTLRARNQHRQGDAFREAYICTSTCKAPEEARLKQEP